MGFFQSTLMLLFFGTPLAVVVWLFDPQIRRWRRFKAELRRREPLPDDVLVSQYFVGSEIPADLPGRVRRLFAEHMGYPAEKLLPDDDFSWEELDCSPLIKAIESEFAIEFTKGELELTAFTIRAVSALVAAKACLPRI